MNGNREAEKLRETRLSATLRPSDGRLAGGPFTSAMPFRILNKGPDYFRRQAEPGARKLSAVERLEADKAKYVKSQQVALTRQAPIQPPIIRKPLVPSGMMINTPPARKVNRSPAEGENTAGRQGAGDRRRPALNLDILNNLINDVCDGPSHCSQSSSSTSPSSSSPSSGAKSISSSLSGEQERSSRLSNNLKPLNHLQPQLRPRQTPQGQVAHPQVPPPSKGSARKHPSLHRSKSDLSDRYSRATADLERFFNYCGLDPEEVEGMGGVERFTRANSDIVSVSKLRSVSTPSSECGDDRVREDEDDEDDGPSRASERVPYGISVIERNARVIKWLYGIRQARDSNNAVSNV
uniref:Protein FAM110A-like n=1 Tax=Pundamilia nyererei TaxID=303518 RepID=A0A3B4FRD3_9CICH